MLSVVWKYPNMSSEDVRFAAKELAERYSVDVTDNLVGELEHLKAIHAANLGDVALSPLDLLNNKSQFSFYSLHLKMTINI